MSAGVYSLLICNVAILLVLFLVVRPLYEAYFTAKIKKDIYSSLSETLTKYFTELEHKLNRELRRLETDMREEVAAGRALERKLINGGGDE